MRKGVFVAALACAALSGCFVFIPGQVVGAVSDAITGDKGEHCVARGTKVGDSVNLGFNRVGLVEYVSETPSSRCRDPMMPMRAALAVRMAADPAPRQPYPMDDGDKVLAFLRGERMEGGSRVCVYERSGGLVEHKVEAEKPCPLSTKR